jgi:ankyrin repeat protein
MRPLLENGADPNAASRDGASPLEDASLRGFDSIAGMLLEHGADVNRINDGSQTTALYAAASFGKANVVKVLLSHAANPNLCGGNRKTPYQTASGNGFGEVATIIKNHGGTITCSGR